MEVDGVNGCLNACVALRKSTSGIPRILLSVGGGGKGSEHFSAAASTPENRRRFAETARELVLRFNIDGIDGTAEFISLSTSAYKTSS
jgi:chitinase